MPCKQIQEFQIFNAAALDEPVLMADYKQTMIYSKSLNIVQNIKKWLFTINWFMSSNQESSYTVKPW